MSVFDLVAILNCLHLIDHVIGLLVLALNHVIGLLLLVGAFLIDRSLVDLESFIVA